MQYSPVVDAEAAMPASERVPAWKALALVFLPALVVFVVTDGIFISLVAGPMFQEVLPGLLRSSPDLVAGILAWLCIVGLVYMFALPRASSYQTAFVQGALAGLCLYGTYELTNMSIISTWRWAIVAADMLWGSVSCGGVVHYHVLFAKQGVRQVTTGGGGASRHMTTV